MANNQVLKNAINQVIKENGNNEITGIILQNALTSIINHFGSGSVFLGVATPTTVPANLDLNSFYITAENGTFVNFGGYVNTNNNFVVFSNTGGGFQKVFSANIKGIDGKTIENYNPNKPDGYIVGSQIFYKGEIYEVVTAATIGQNPETNPSKFKIVYDGTKTLARELGFEIVEPGVNLITELVGSNFNDSTLWSVGYLNRTTPPATGVQTFRFSTKYYPISPGRHDFGIAIYGNAVVCFYDSNKNIIGYLERGNLSSTMLYVQHIVPDGTAYFRISHFYGNGTGDGSGSGGQPNTGIYVKTIERSYIPTDEVFLRTEKMTEKTVEILKDEFGVSIIEPGTEFLGNYIGSSTLNTELWLPGFLRANGTIEPGANWFHSKNYIKLMAGTYEYRMFFTGNARAILYNTKTMAIDELLVNTAGSESHTKTFTITEEKYFRFSFRESATQPDRIDLIHLKNVNSIYPSIITDFNIDDYLPEPQPQTVDLRKVYKDTYKPRLRKKIATFICDDGHINDKLWYIPLLDEYGVKSTLAICRHWAKQGNASSRLSEQEIIDYFKAGHDIANHTLEHLRMNEITLDEAENQILGNKLYLENLLNAECEMFISPFGIRNPNLDFIISKYHKANFISGYAINNPTPLDSYFINRLSFDAAQTNVARYESVIKPGIDEAAANNQWLVFAVHSGYGEYSTGNTVDRRQELRQTIEYLLEQGFEIMTAKRAYSYYKNWVEIGVKRYNANYYQLGMDLTENNVNYF